MPCPRCTNAKFPAEFDTIKGKAGRADVQCCKECSFPTIGAEQRRRIGMKLIALKPALPLGRELKGIDKKYYGEILDKHHRPMEELEDLRGRWEKEATKRENFYDWIADIEPQSKVLQLGAEERQEYVVQISAGNLKGKYVEPKYTDYAFVLSEEGKFYAAPKKTDGKERVHHSSFLSGAAAQCAGVLFCNKVIGEHEKSIFYVKDYSGHYQPKMPEIKRLQDKLKEIEEDLTFWYYGGHHSPKFKGKMSEFDTTKEY